MISRHENGENVVYMTCYSCLQPIATRSGADVKYTYHHGKDSEGRDSPLCRAFHPDCAPIDAELRESIDPQRPFHDPQRPWTHSPHQEH
jgi:hypothetical protein